MAGGKPILVRVSSVSDRMSRRRLASGSEVDTPATVTLADLDRGQRAKVAGYGDDVAGSTARRFFDLGIVPGIEVAMVRRAAGDPVIPFSCRSPCAPRRRADHRGTGSRQPGR